MTPEDLWKTFSSYLDEATHLRTQLTSSSSPSPPLDILIGFESDLPDLSRPHPFSDLDKLLQAEGGPDGRVEYMVGSVHHVFGVPIDFDETTYHRAVAVAAERVGDGEAGELKGLGEVEKYLVAYLDAQHALLTRYHPSIIGHFDLCRLYTPSLRLDEDPVVWERVKRNVEVVVGYGGLVEVNCASVRKGWSTPYPGREVLRVRSSPLDSAGSVGRWS